MHSKILEYFVDLGEMEVTQNFSLRNWARVVRKVGL